jgi:hypothetical protein
MVNNPGWGDIVKLAEQTLTQIEREVIEEEDDAKAAGLRRDAKGARKFWVEFTNRLNASSRVSDEPSDDDWLEICS